MTDVFVIGGGPAGLAAAIAARRKGFEVMVADGGQPPLEKPCGEGMMPGTLEVLHDLGIHVSAADGFAFPGIRFVNGNAQVQSCFPNGLGMGMRRLLLHKRMVEAAHACGVHFLWNTPVSGILSDGVVAGKDIVPARWIIGAESPLPLARGAGGAPSSNHTRGLSLCPAHPPLPFAFFFFFWFGAGAGSFWLPWRRGRGGGLWFFCLHIFSF